MVRTSNGFEIAETDLEIARAGRIFWHAAVGVAGISDCKSDARSRGAGVGAPGSLCDFAEDPAKVNEIVAKVKSISPAWPKINSRRSGSQAA